MEEGAWFPDRPEVAPEKGDDTAMAWGRQRGTGRKRGSG